MADIEKSFVSAVVYVHNDANVIGAFIEALDMTLTENFTYSEIICVDDASTDGSVEAIDNAGRAAKSSVTLVHMSKSHGLEASMGAGVDIAIGDFVIELTDASWPVDSTAIKDAYELVLQGNDIVSVGPASGGRLSSKIFYGIFNKGANLRYDIATETFRVVTRRAINSVEDLNKAIPYRKAAYANCGLKMGRIDIASQKGSRKEEHGLRTNLAVDSLVIFTDVGYKLSAGVAILMMVAAIAMGIYSIVVFATGKPVSGWFTTMAFLSFSFFCMSVLMTIVLRYLQVLMRLVFNNKHYSYEYVSKIGSKSE